MFIDHSRKLQQDAEILTLVDLLRLPRVFIDQNYRCVIGVLKDLSFLNMNMNLNTETFLINTIGTLESLSMRNIIFTELDSSSSARRTIIFNNFDSVEIENLIFYGNFNVKSCNILLFDNIRKVKIKTMKFTNFSVFNSSLVAFNSVLELYIENLEVENITITTIVGTSSQSQKVDLLSFINIQNLSLNNCSFRNINKP